MPFMESLEVMSFLILAGFMVRVGWNWEPRFMTKWRMFIARLRSRRRS